MPLVPVETLTLDALNALTADGADALVLNESYANAGGLQSSKWLYKNRLFAGRLFAAALWRGVGEDVIVTPAPKINVCLTVEICTNVELVGSICTGVLLDAPICTGINLTANVGGAC